MDWITRLMPYYGQEIRLWIEDVSGEKQTAPAMHRLYKTELTDDQQIKFFINSTQFLSIPLFGGERTQLVMDTDEPHFFSRDEDSQLIYWVYFLGGER